MMLGGDEAKLQKQKNCTGHSNQRVKNILSLGARTKRVGWVRNTFQFDTTHKQGSFCKISYRTMQEAIIQTK